MKKLKLTYCEDKQKRKGSNRKNLFDLVEAAVMKSFPWVRDNMMAVCLVLQHWRTDNRRQKYYWINKWDK